MKNKNNIQSAQTFNPPTVHEDATNGGKCYVYDPAAWQNRNKPRAEEIVKAAGGAKPKAITSPRTDVWSGAGA